MKRILFIGIDGGMFYFMDRFHKEGIIPNISKLIDGGSMLRVLPSPPCDTPTNWTTVVTGSWTGTHGVTSFFLHLPGEKVYEGLLERGRSQLTKYCRAEFIWDVLAEVGEKSLVLNYPGGWPPRRSEVIRVEGWWYTPGVPFRIIDREQHYYYGMPITTRGQELELVKPPTWVKVRGYAFKLPLAGISKEHYMIVSEGKAFFFREGDTKPYSVLSKGEESDWIEEIVDPSRLSSRWLAKIKEPLKVMFKVRVEELGMKPLAIHVVRGPVFVREGWTVPRGLAEELIRSCGLSEGGYVDVKVEAHAGYELIGTSLKELKMRIGGAREEADNLVRVASYVSDRYGVRHLFMHFHLLDGINHAFLGYLWKGHPLYSEEAEEAAMNVYRASYGVIDYLVGELIKRLCDEDTIVVLISDHAALPVWKYFWIPRAFEREGLLKYKWDPGNGVYKIDLKRTKAFPYMEPSYVWVNLMGREEEGIVKPGEEYEEVVERVIDVLYDIRDPDTGRRVIKLALRKEDASFLGQWGDRVGDVVYFLEPGYSFYDGSLEGFVYHELSPEGYLEEEIRSLRIVRGYHAAYLPTERIGDFTVDAVAILSGPGIKEGFVSDRPVNMVDIAPTLSTLLGIRRPAESEGRILWEILED